MTARHLLAAGAASAALAIAAPVAAQGTSYEYAQPIPAYQPPVVPPPPAQAPRAYEYEYDYGAPPPVEPVVQPPVVGGYPAPYPVPHHASGAHAYPQGAYAYPQGGYAHGGAYRPPAGFERDAWLDDCRDRIRGVDRRERGAVIGGLLGAIAGGVVGNRVWDSERLAGTLLGGGLGTLGGLAIGSAVGAANDRRHADECGYYLDSYMARWPGYAQHYGYGYPGYGYGHAGYGYGYGIAGYAWTTTMVPVMVQIPQRAIVRETVTEEWVEEEVRRPAPRPRTKYVPAPAPTKYVPAKRTKYVKGK